MKTTPVARFVALAMVLGAVTAGQKANAAVVIFNFDTIITGPVPGGSNIATLTITDVAADTVHLLLSHDATSAAGQFVTDLYMNLHPYVAVTASDQTPPAKFTGFSQGLNSESSAGLNFDLLQMFETNNMGGGVNRLKPGESVTFKLSGSGVDALDFLSPAEPTNGQRTDVFAMIHLQGIAGGGSVKLAAVPEPATFGALALGLAGLLWRRRNGKRA